MFSEENSKKKKSVENSFLTNILSSKIYILFKPLFNGSKNWPGSCVLFYYYTKQWKMLSEFFLCHQITENVFTHANQISKYQKIKKFKNENQKVIFLNTIGAFSKYFLFYWIVMEWNDSTNIEYCFFSRKCFFLHQPT